MRMSDWSSDVCSSDLLFPAPEPSPRDRGTVKITGPEQARNRPRTGAEQDDFRGLTGKEAGVTGGAGLGRRGHGGPRSARPVLRGIRIVEIVFRRCRNASPSDVFKSTVGEVPGRGSFRHIPGSAERRVGKGGGG